MSKTCLKWIRDILVARTLAARALPTSLPSSLWQMARPRVTTFFSIAPAVSVYLSYRL